MKKIAIIPARGGSKRIERKNIKPFRGVPIIAYSILAALKSGCFDEVMVSTDDEEIAEVARKFGANVPFMRSDATSDDYATTADVITEVLQNYQSEGITFDALACIYATAPFITADQLRNASAILDNGVAEAAFTCVEYSYPIQRSLAIREDGRIGMKFPEYSKSRSQDLDKSYHDAGQFYFSTVRQFESSGSLWGPDTMPVILSELEVQDLDTLTDWRLAEIKYDILALPGRFETADYVFLPYPEMDAELSRKVLDERNADEVRRWMINREAIAKESHDIFVKNLAVSRNKQYYAVLGKDGELVGSVNLDRIDNTTLERGIWIAKESRGHGHAAKMLTELYLYLFKNRGISNIITQVRKENQASLALEKSLGAVNTSEDKEYLWFIKELNN